MSSLNKFFSLAGIIIFLGFQSWIIFDQFSQTRLIELRRELPKAQLKLENKYYDVKAHTEEVTIKVNPDGFFDYLLLTNSNGNLLSITLTIITVLCLVFYHFYRRVENVYWVAKVILKLIFIAFIIGLDYTIHFWKDVNSGFTSDIFLAIKGFKVPLCLVIMLYLSSFAGEGKANATVQAD
ncbi:MAG TPA: hypothetical protein VK668_18845 [Mucilaginibacter sp.]|nr:hypothetical protein [Mucilaginibacter sp.]